MSYPFDIIRTIARNFYIRPTGRITFDWTPENDKWEKLSEEQRQLWYDIAIKWLDAWKEKNLEVYEYYIMHGLADLDSEGYNNLISVRSIAF